MYAPSFLAYTVYSTYCPGLLKLADKFDSVGETLFTIVPFVVVIPVVLLDGATASVTKLVWLVENFTAKSALLGVTLALDEILSVVENAAKPKVIADIASTNATIDNILICLCFSI